MVGEGVNKKSPAILTDNRAWLKLTFSTNIQSKYDVCFSGLHVVVAQVVCRAQLVVDYVLYHHILAVKLLNDDIAVLRVGMNATNIVVRNPNRIVAVFGINHKVPRADLALICHRFNLGVVKRGNLIENFLDKLLLVFRPIAVKHSREADVQQEDDNRYKYCSNDIHNDYCLIVVVVSF